MVACVASNNVRMCVVLVWLRYNNKADVFDPGKWLCGSIKARQFGFQTAIQYNCFSLLSSTGYNGC